QLDNMTTPEDREASDHEMYLGSPEPAPRPAAPRSYDPHPLFPREDGTPEDADIQFVSFLRRTPVAGVKHCPLDFPAAEIQSWEQVVDFWGGGDYQAIAKDKHHRVIRHYPKLTWQSFEGEPKPLVKPGTPAPAAPRPVEPPAQPAA